MIDDDIVIRIHGYGLLRSQQSQFTTCVTVKKILLGCPSDSEIESGAPVSPVRDFNCSLSHWCESSGTALPNFFWIPWRIHPVPEYRVSIHPDSLVSSSQGNI
jgi:hypothetical protein